MSNREHRDANAEVEELLTQLPEEMEGICAAASEPLEIAAALEARGVSSRVAQDRFGEPDIFALAERLFAAVAPASIKYREARATQRPGGPRELLRGAMFGAPGIMFAAILGALHLHLASWTYLLALTTGWAFAEAIAALASALGSRNVELGSLALWWMILTGCVTAALAAIGVATLHGGWMSVAVATVVALYMVSCSALLLHGRFRAMGLPLVPATVLTLVFLLHRPFHIPVALMLVVVVAAIVFTIGAALLDVPRRFWIVPPLSVSDIAVSGRYFVHGVLSGLATSLIIVLSSGSSAKSSVIPVAAYPVLITLGVMEWQLHSFRSRAQLALQDATSTARFARSAWRAFCISLSAYVFALSLACVAVGGYLVLHHLSVPVVLLVAEGCLGCTFFVGLVTATCARMDLVLLSGGFGLLAYTATFAVHELSTGSFDQGVARASCCCAISLSLALLIVLSRGSIRSAFSYQ